MKKHIFAFFMTIVLITSLAGCNISPESVTSSEAEQMDESRVKVITTLFPQYDFVRQIAGDKVTVTLIVPPGVEAHAYEPTPQDIVSIQKADMFVYTGESMEPWAHKVIETVGEENIYVVEAGEGLFDMSTDVHDHQEDHVEHEGNDDNEDEEHEDHDHNGVDPHVWLDPVKAQEMVEHILLGLIKVAPEYEEEFRINADAYIESLDALHHEFEDAFD